MYLYLAKILHQINKLTCFILGCITTADGSSMVRIGDTTVICGIKAEVSEPNVNFPKEGYLGKNISILIHHFKFAIIYSFNVFYSSKCRSIAHLFT